MENNKIIVFIDDFNQDYIIENLFNNHQTKEDFLKQLEDNLVLFSRRKDEIFYDKNSIEYFCNFLTEIKDDANYLIDFRSKLADILQNAQPISPNIDLKEQYFRWNLFENKAMIQIQNNILIEIIKKQIEQKENQFFVLVTPTNSQNPYQKRPFIVCLVDDFNHIEALPRILKIDYITDKMQANEWINKNRTPLKINKNNKHGENGVGAHKSNKNNKVGILYGSIKEADELLQTAIFDFREQTKKPLYNYDKKNKKIIVFQYEGTFQTKNQSYQSYHAFHLEMDNKQQIEEQQIPNEILKELEKLF